jgi:hypothetical protein
MKYSSTSIGWRRRRMWVIRILRWLGYIMNI